MTVKILVLKSEAEARLLSGLLDQADIPHMLKSFHDSAYDGMWQTDSAWGTLWADEENREEIKRIYEGMLMTEIQDDEA